jgi:hypothetical protein
MTKISGLFLFSFYIVNLPLSYLNVPKTDRPKATRSESEAKQTYRHHQNYIQPNEVGARDLDNLANWINTRTTDWTVYGAPQLIPLTFSSSVCSLQSAVCPSSMYPFVALRFSTYCTDTGSIKTDKR